MEYTVVITQNSSSLWRAYVPALPECEAEAETRDGVVNRIKERLEEVVPHSELLRIDLPIAPATSQELPVNGNSAAFSENWPDFGIFRDDPTWGELFDEIERRRLEGGPEE